MMIHIEAVRPALRQLAVVLANPWLDKLLGPTDRLALEEVRYHARQVPDGFPPYWTSIALVVEGETGSFRLAFEFDTMSLSITPPDDLPANSLLHSNDLGALTRAVQSIIATASAAEIDGGTTPEMWDGVARPLDSSKVKPWWIAQDGMQDRGLGADAEQDMDEL